MRFPQFSRSLVLGCLSAVLLLLIALVPAFLQAGRFLTPEDPLEPVDAIVSNYGASTYRAEHLARLYHAGYAPRVILSNDRSYVPAVGTDRSSELMARALVEAGVPASALYQVDRYLASTAEEAQVLADLLREQGIRSIILVAEPQRQRRAQLSLAGATNGQVRIINSPAPNPQWVPERWWASRFGVSSVLNEYPRLAYYALRGRF